MADPLATIRSAQAVRAQSRRIYDLAVGGETHFAVRQDQLESTAQFVLQVIRDQYPDLDIPFHTRWNHLRVGGVDRVARWQSGHPDMPKAVQARALFDAVFVSVLLDAGAGPDWCYQEADTQQGYTRSEGLALAAWQMFLSGAFSSDVDHPFQVDAGGLQQFTEQQLQGGFQASDTNPLLGCAGRAALMQTLGDVLAKHWGASARPSDLLDHMPQPLTAAGLLAQVLHFFSEIWPSRLSWQGVPLGDVWHYPPFGPETDIQALVPFHKLSQWLTYSLIWPTELAGMPVLQPDELTGLPEYRNGGLLLDSGLLRLREPALAASAHAVSDPLIIEWRALTVVLLDQLADCLRAELGYDAEQFPLAKVLEGGTWAAGRILANRRSVQGEPPLKIISDGTVF